MPADNITELLKKIKDVGGHVTVDANGNLHTKWLYGENKALRAQLKAHKPRIVAKLAPNLLQIRMSGAKSFGDKMYDNFKAVQRTIQVGNELVNEEVQNVPERGINNVPGLPFLGKDIAPKLLKGLMPESVTGKVIAASTPFIKSGTALKRILTGVGVGAGAGEVSGEGAGMGALQGAAQMPSELVQLPGMAKEAAGLANRFELVSNQARDEMGKVFGKIIGHPWVDAQLAKGRNIVDVLLDNEAQVKIGNRYQADIDGIATDLSQRAKDHATQLANAFKQKYGFAPGGTVPVGFKANMQIIRESAEAQLAQRNALKINREFNSLRRSKSIAGAGSRASSGLPTTSATGRQAQQRFHNLKEALESKVGKWGQDLSDRFDAANEAYSQFQGLKQLVRVKGLRNAQGDIDLRAAQELLRDNPAPFQQRLKSAWPVVKDTIRRYAPDEGSLDMPGVIRRGGQVGRAHVSESGNVGFMANLMNLIPTRDKSVMSRYIGQAPRVIRSVPTTARTAAAESLNRTFDYLRPPLLQMLEKANNSEEKPPNAP